ncbi:MAG: hypothetical protein WAN48_03285 [Actinomycetes bacterium]
MYPSMDLARAHVRALEHDSSRVVVRSNRPARERIVAFWQRHTR